MKSRQAALVDAAQRFEAAGIDTARLDADLLLAHVLGIDRTRLYTDGDAPFDDKPATEFDSLVRRRVAREPVAHLLGEREFWSLKFRVSPATLVPRPDTETLVEAVLEYVRDHVVEWPLSILDLGTGSGCILLSLLHELPQARGLGTDVSAAAIEIAEANAHDLALDGRTEFRNGDWFSALQEGERFDLILSNPPYIREADLATLAPDVRDFEPHGALVAGKDGLGAYRALFAGAAGAATEGASLWLEIGMDQGPDVTALGLKNGLGLIAARKDLAGIERALGFRVGSANPEAL